MEPIFTSPTSSGTVTRELQAKIDAAIATLPPAHCLSPRFDEVFESKDSAITRLQNWSFTKGFALVKESSKTSKGQVVRVYLDCIHHKNATKNSRKLGEAERKRVQTKTQALGCPFSFVISWNEQLGYWKIRPKSLEHNHPPNPDPFQYHQHEDKMIGHRAAIAMARTHRGILSYKDSAAVLTQDGLEIRKKKFYNLQRKEGKGTLTRQEELEYILQLLEDEGIHVRPRYEYILDPTNGERTSQVIKDLF
jgi:hypothetical protein